MVGTFDQIEEAINQTEIEDDWWGSSAMSGSTAGGAAAPEPPEILSQVQVGPVRATTMRAADASGLNEWLAQNGYRIRDDVAALLSGYVERGWYFVALKITSNAELSGGLDPIQFSFDSEQLVYPMELSRAATAEQRVRLYVFEDHRMQVQTLAGAAVGDANAGTRWAGAAPEALDGYGEYLTVLDLSFQKPAVDIPGDLALARASNDAEVKPLQQTRIVRFLGMPAGWALVLVLGIAVLVLIFVVPIVRSRRSAS